MQLGYLQNLLQALGQMQGGGFPGLLLNNPQGVQGLLSQMFMNNQNAGTPGPLPLPPSPSPNLAPPTPPPQQTTLLPPAPPPPPGPAIAPAPAANANQPFFGIPQLR